MKGKRTKDENNLLAQRYESYDNDTPLELVPKKIEAKFDCLYPFVHGFFQPRCRMQNFLVRN